MTAKSEKFTPPESKNEPPKYIVAYSAMMTILLAFFIMLNSLATVQEYGLKGAGLGLFRMSFNSLGLPAFLTGGRKPVGLNSPGGKHQTETDTDEAEEGKERDSRLIELDKRDIKDALTAVLKTHNRVVLPLDIRYGDSLNRESKKRLAEIARLLRQSDSEVLVCATLPRGGRGARHPWYDASMWALLVAKYLCHKGNVPARRLTAVGYAASPQGEQTADSEDAPSSPIPHSSIRNPQWGEPTISLILRPPKKSYRANDTGDASLRQMHFRKDIDSDYVNKKDKEK